MGQEKKEPRKSKSGSIVDNPATSKNIFFSCPGNYLGQTKISGKNDFNQNEAEDLIKKHLKKSHIAMNLKCESDRVLFVANTLKDQKKIRKYALYSDIKYVYIYSLNPQLFMICVEDSEQKGKKFYEGFQCEDRINVTRLCETIRTAQESPNSQLPSTFNLQHRIQSMESPANPPLYKNSYNEPTESRYEPTESRYEPTESRYIVPSSTNRQTTPGNNETEFVPVVTNEFVRSSQSHLQIIESDPNMANRANTDTLSDYGIVKSQDYTPDELTNLFGDDLTFIQPNKKGDLNAQSGPVFIYCARAIRELETYRDGTLDTATNSPNNFR